MVKLANRRPEEFQSLSRRFGYQYLRNLTEEDLKLCQLLL